MEQIIINQMRNRIIEIVNQFSDISITGFKNQMPEIHGDLDFIFPVKNVENSNILLVSGVNEQFIKTIIDLINEEISMFQPCDPLVVAYDSAEMYKLPLARPTKGFKGYKSTHWLPLLIKKGAKFPKIDWKPFS